MSLEPSPDKRGEEAARKVVAWLRSGGRERVRAILRRAVKQTEARNKARYLDPKILNERFTI